MRAHRRWRPRYSRLLWAVLTVAGLLYFAHRKPVRAGDGLEYWATLQAWFEHGTPDIRQGDLDELARLLDVHQVVPRASVSNTPIVPTAAGARYTLHFWLYPLTAVPAKLALRLLRGNELAALQVTNFIFFAATLYFILFRGPANARWRWHFAALTAVTPVVWYLPWPHTEVYIWAAVCFALVLLRNGRHGWAALAASLGALQNPAVACLAALAVVLAIADGKRRWALGAPMLGAAVSLTAPVFYFAQYGHPNLLHKAGHSDPGLISLARVWSFLGDLNQGMLPYAPGVLLLGVVATVHLTRRRNWRALGVVGTALAMIAVCASTPNWNGGAAGVLRYVVWVIPLFAWAIVECPWPERWAVRAVGATLVVQIAILSAGSSRARYLEHNLLARNVLSYAPWLYSPEPDIFAEREMHGEIHEERPFRSRLPLGFSRRSGVVTKILVDGCSLEWLPLRFRVDPAYLKSIVDRRGEGLDLFYLHPPAGAVLRRLPTLPDRVTTTFWSACTRGETPYDRDPGFLRALEGAIPPRALIFEWPGRAEDALQEEMLARAPDRLVETLAIAGFAGISVARSVLPDQGAEVMARLTQALADTPPLLSDSGHWGYYDLHRLAATLRERHTGPAWAARQDEALNPLALTWGPGFHGPETDSERGVRFRWATHTASLTIDNGSARERTALFEARFATALPGPAQLRITGDLLSETLALSGNRIPLARTLRIPPGSHALRFVSDAKALRPPNDPRVLVFRIEDSHLREQDAP